MNICALCLELHWYNAISQMIGIIRMFMHCISWHHRKCYQNFMVIYHLKNETIPVTIKSSVVDMFFFPIKFVPMLFNNTVQQAWTTLYSRDLFFEIVLDSNFKKWAKFILKRVKWSWTWEGKGETLMRHCNNQKVTKYRASQSPLNLWLMWSEEEPKRD